MRILALVLAELLLWPLCSPGFAQTDGEQRMQAANLQKLATEVRELDRCMAIVSVEDLSAFEPLTRAYFQKADALAKAIEDHVTRFAGRRGKHETVLAFKYRVWENSLRAGSERARLPPALNKATCAALSLPH